MDSDLFKHLNALAYDITYWWTCVAKYKKAFFWWIHLHPASHGRGKDLPDTGKMTENQFKYAAVLSSYSLNLQARQYHQSCHVVLWRTSFPLHYFSNLQVGWLLLGSGIDTFYNLTMDTFCSADKVASNYWRILRTVIFYFHEGRVDRQDKVRDFFWKGQQIQKKKKTKMSSGAKGASKAAIDAAAWMFNVVTSVGIILVNKALMATYGFTFGIVHIFSRLFPFLAPFDLPILLSGHFLILYILYSILSH